MLVEDMADLLMKLNTIRGSGMAKDYHVVLVAGCELAMVRGPDRNAVVNEMRIVRHIVADCLRHALAAVPPLGTQDAELLYAARDWTDCTEGHKILLGMIERQQLLIARLMSDEEGQIFEEGRKYGVEEGVRRERARVAAEAKGAFLKAMAMKAHDAHQEGEV